MKPYWIKISQGGLSVGITARSAEDARTLFDLAFGASYVFVNIEPIADMRDLDQNHVVPNMGNWFRRGIWYPLGYAQISD